MRHAVLLLKEICLVGLLRKVLCLTTCKVCCYPCCNRAALGAGSALSHRLGLARLSQASAMYQVDTGQENELVCF